MIYNEAYMNNLFSRLVKLAEKLDNFGFFAEADQLDHILIRLAMSMEDARRLLGISFNASEDEIQKAWKAKAMEHHPDRGGDLEKMKEVNIARDLLLGERKPERSREEPAPYGTQQYRTKQPPKNEKKVSFTEAAREAGVPEGVKWKFATQTAHTPYLGDKSARAAVAYGATDDSHVFVGIQHDIERNYFSNTDIDTYTMWVKQVPKSSDLSIVAPAVIRELWGNFDPLIKGYNAKVRVYSKDVDFDNYAIMSGGNVMSFKDAMSIMGEKTPEAWKDRKINVIFKLTGGKNFMSPDIVLIVNGKEYPLNEKTNDWAWKTKPPLPRYIIGEYAYSDSKKDMTRMDKNKASKALEVLIKRLPEFGESEDLVKALTVALDQIQKKV